MKATGGKSINKKRSPLSDSTAVTDEHRKKKLKKKHLRALQADEVIQPPHSSSGSRRKLLVFDINKVLISRRPMSRIYIVRPHARDFIRAIQEHFDIAVWTSMKNTVAKPIIADIFSGCALQFQWYQSSCTAVRPDDATEGQKLNFTKDLSRLWKQFPQYDASNTILLDDSPDKCINNWEFNCVHPVPFEVYDKQQELFYQLLRSERQQAEGAEAEDLLHDDELRVNGTLWQYLVDLSQHSGSLRTFHSERGTYTATTAAAQTS